MPAVFVTVCRLWSFSVPLLFHACLSKLFLNMQRFHCDRIYCRQCKTMFVRGKI